jgi:putative hydrolase of HD superfamily
MRKAMLSWVDDSRQTQLIPVFAGLIYNLIKPKSSITVVKMETSNLFKQIEFIKEVDKLKYIFRKTKLFSSDRNENDAEHSWHLALMAIVLADHANFPVDVLKVVKMLLIHDIVEIDAGDTFIYDTQKNHDNTIEERQAAKRIFGLLPDEQADELIAIWEEFEEQQTNEAKFARAMDRLEPLLQNASNNGGTWNEFGVNHEKVYAKKQVIKNGSTVIWEYAEQLIEECVQKGILKR